MHVWLMLYTCVRIYVHVGSPERESRNRSNPLTQSGEEYLQYERVSVEGQRGETAVVLALIEPQVSRTQFLRHLVIKVTQRRLFSTL